VGAKIPSSGGLLAAELRGFTAVHDDTLSPKLGVRFLRSAHTSDGVSSNRSW